MANSQMLWISFAATEREFVVVSANQKQSVDINNFHNWTNLSIEFKQSTKRRQYRAKNRNEIHENCEFSIEIVIVHSSLENAGVEENA